MRTKRIAALCASIFAIFALIYSSLPTHALEAVVFATKDALYEKLEEAAKINVITAAMKNCMNKLWEAQENAINEFLENGTQGFGAWDPMGGDNMADDAIFSWDHLSTKTRSSAVWFDELISGDTDGHFECYDKDKKGNAIFRAFMKFVANKPSGPYTDVLCNEGAPRLIQRWDPTKARSAGNKDAGRSDWDCYLFDDADVAEGDWDTGGYILVDEWESILREIYENYTDKLGNTNQYLPAWGDVGKYDNVDGYFSYMLDYGKKCSSAADKSYNAENLSSNTYPATTVAREDTKIIVKKRWYHLSSNPDWKGSLVEKNPTNSCSKLLTRMDTIHDKFNGIGNDRGHGYEGIIVALLNDTCAKLKADDCDTDGCYWDKVLEAAQNIIDNPDSYSTDDVQAAKDDKKKIETAQGDGKWYQEDGNPTDEDGKIYQCLVTTTGNIQEQEHESETEEITPEPQEEEEQKPNCYTKSGVLGWIVCPIIDGARTAIIESYGTLVEPALKMDTRLFKAGGDKLNGTYNAWGTFRTIGNVAFVIMFTLVIISQLTGYKAGEYGIKKALPKLLVTAILLNMSFILCQGAIDVCNLAGRGVGTLLQSITKKIEYPEKIDFNAGDSTITVNPTDEGAWQDTNTWGASFAKNWLGNSALIIIVAAIGVGVILSQGWAIIVPILMALVGILIAVLGLVAILGVRQALAVMLVAVSPIAIACYILPNTKGLFTKWLKAFQGLLLAYPICSAVVYGGDMVATLLLQVANSTPKNNFWLLISAAAVSVAPIFIIPSVIKKSMGALSGGIANLSEKLGGYSKGKVKSGLENTAVVNRRNYNQMMRGQMHSSHLSSYTAKRGRRYMKGIRGTIVGNRMNAGLWVPQGMSLKYKASQSSINAYNADATKAYSSSFEGLSDAEITRRMLASVKGKRLRDPNMIVAGLAAIHDEDKLTDAVRALASTGALDDLKDRDLAAYQRVADVLENRQDSIINQSMGKLMNAGQTVGGMWAGGANSKLAKEVRDAGTGIMARQNKDVFATQGARELFSAEQKAAAIAANPTGGKAANIAKMEKDADDEELKDIAKALGVRGVKNLNTDEFEVTMTNPVTGEKEQKVYDGTLAILGKGDAKKGAEIVKEVAETEIKQLNSETGRESRPDMDKKAAELLGIKSGGEAPTGRISSGAISSGIDLNNMTEDEERFVLKHADAVLNETASEDETLVISHPTAPDLRPVEETGSLRDKDGKIIAEHRDAEGSRPDYHPPKEGESPEDYKDREEYEQELAKYAEKHPKKAEETSSEYYDRIKKDMKGFDAWKAAGKGEIKSDDD